MTFVPDASLAEPLELDDRRLRVPGTRNLRDVGGYATRDGRRTRWRTLYRTDSLDRLPPSAQADLVTVGLRCVIDLRWPHELLVAPSVFADSDQVSYRSIPLLEDDPTPEFGLAHTYRHMLDERADQLVEVVRALLAPGGLPAVIGCAAGKDRTGVTIALLLSTVGVPAEVVVADYLLTGEAFARAEADEHLEADWREGPLLVDCPPEYMLAMLEHLEHRHGGAAELLRRNGVAEDEVERLRDLLTEVA